MGWFGRAEARKRTRLLEHAGELRRDGDAAGAVEALAPLLVDRPDDPAANVEMARALQLLDDAAGAEEHYRRALRVQLAYPIVVELAGVIGAQGRPDEAEETLEAALLMTQKDPTLEKGEVFLMRAMLAVGRKDRAAAEAALSDLEKAKPGEALKRHAARLRERLNA